MSEIPIFKCTVCKALFLDKPTSKEHHEMLIGSDMQLYASGEVCRGDVVVKEEDQPAQRVDDSSSED